MHYKWQHIVTFEETNLVGNVYYANHIRWQGACREMFLKDHAPAMLTELNQGLAMVTTRVFCEYFNELFAFDEVTLKMRAGEVSNSRVVMRFDYYRDDELIAKGEQQIACMRNKQPVPIPNSLRKALTPYL